MPVYVVTAYRWGCSNGSQYLVTATEDKEQAILAAKSERDYRGGKYGVEVVEVIHKFNEKEDCAEPETKRIYYAPSAQDEGPGPYQNAVINAREQIGSFVHLSVMGVTWGKEWVGTLDWIKAKWQEELARAEMLAGIMNKPEEPTHSSLAP